MAESCVSASATLFSKRAKHNRANKCKHCDDRENIEGLGRSHKGLRFSFEEWITQTADVLLSTTVASVTPIMLSASKIFLHLSACNNQTCQLIGQKHCILFKSNVLLT